MIKRLIFHFQSNCGTSPIIKGVEAFVKLKKINNTLWKKKLSSEKKRILPEIIQFTVDFFVFNVAAAVLAQRRSAD